MSVLFIAGATAIDVGKGGINLDFATAHGHRCFQNEGLGFSREGVEAIGSFVGVLSAQHIDAFLVIGVGGLLDGFDFTRFAARDVSGVTCHVENGGNHLFDMPIADVGLCGHGHMAIDAVAAFLDLVEQVAAVLGVVWVAQGDFHVARAYGFGIGLMAGEAVVCLDEFHSRKQ